MRMTSDIFHRHTEFLYIGRSDVMETFPHSLGNNPPPLQKLAEAA